MIIHQTFIFSSIFQFSIKLHHLFSRTLAFFVFWADIFGNKFPFLGFYFKNQEYFYSGITLLFSCNLAFFKEFPYNPSLFVHPAPFSILFEALFHLLSHFLKGRSVFLPSFSFKTAYFSCSFVLFRQFYTYKVYVLSFSILSRAFKRCFCVQSSHFLSFFIRSFFQIRNEHAFIYLFGFPALPAGELSSTLIFAFPELLFIFPHETALLHKKSDAAAKAASL